MIIGLTGGIASGKSTVSKILDEMGIRVVDADIIAREVMDSREVVEKITDEFGEKILDENGKLDRSKLREVAFSSKRRVELLNSIVHPSVIERFKNEREKSVTTGEILVFDIPLLFEAKMENLCDKVIVVYVDSETQIKRVMERDGSKRETAVNIIKNQMPLSEKLKRADIKIKNDGTIEGLEKKIKEIFSKF
ncbi:dephospho-CoA kinase [uncultured Ilyobacter sp.]|uniref:dephospho-CoA kinase n=1 Tax=uncultured Ilyobacter sp. TaxID=544433 RepID=UPI0029F50C59|nr:dephospho-CoA kinase [uncultured Ilyobacter sp.]